MIRQSITYCRTPWVISHAVAISTQLPYLLLTDVCDRKKQTSTQGYSTYKSEDFYHPFPHLNGLTDKKPVYIVIKSKHHQKN